MNGFSEPPKQTGASVDNSNHIIELLSILASDPTPSRGFETKESEFERHQQRKHEALREIAQLQGNPVVHKMLATVNREMPANGGTRDQVLHAAQKLSNLLVPAVRRAQAKADRETNHERFIREAGAVDPFLEGANLTRDAFSLRGEVEPDTWADGVNLERRH
jgi:hypothetical protein